MLRTLARVGLLFVGSLLIIAAVLPIVSTVGDITIYDHTGSEPTTCDPPNIDISISPYYSEWFHPQATGDPSRLDLKLYAVDPVTATVYWYVYVDGTMNVANGYQTVMFGGGQQSLGISVTGWHPEKLPMLTTDMYRMRVNANAPPGYPVCLTMMPAWTLYGTADTDGGCPEGTHWDIALGYCVPDDTSHPCDDGYHWNETRGECEENVVPPDNGGGGNCTAGQHWDDSTKTCVKDEETCRWFLLVVGIIFVVVALTWRS